MGKNLACAAFFKFTENTKKALNIESWGLVKHKIGRGNS